MQTSEFCEDGFSDDTFDYFLVKRIVYNGFNPKIVTYIAEIVQPFGDFERRKVFKTKKGAENFLRRFYNEQKSIRS